MSEQLESNMWVLEESPLQVVRYGYEQARRRNEIICIMFLPVGGRFKGRVLRARWAAFNALLQGPSAACNDGYGNAMVYRVCCVTPPGELAKRAGMQNPEELRLLNQLIRLGWDKTYRWLSVEELDPRR